MNLLTESGAASFMKTMQLKAGVLKVHQTMRFRAHNEIAVPAKKSLTSEKMKFVCHLLLLSKASWPIVSSFELSCSQAIPRDKRS